MAALNRFWSYFDLTTVEALYGKAGTQAKRQLSIYAGTLLGALSKLIYDLADTGGSLELRGVHDPVALAARSPRADS